MSRRKIVAKTFDSGPGFEVFIGEYLIGSIGKHYREKNWWWQIDDPTHLSRRKYAAGMQPSKSKALTKLFEKWKTIGKSR
jgi:hypothetical protein